MSPERVGAAATDGDERRAAKFGRDDFAREYELAWRVLWCIAAGITGERTAAEDIVQQAALTALQQLDAFDPATSFVAWMGRIVRNTAINEMRKNQRRRTAATDPIDIDTAPARALLISPHRPITTRGEVAPEQESFDDRLIAALRRLDEVARCCLLLRVVLDMPYKEISLALDIPSGTAMSHVDRTRKALREILAEPSHNHAPRISP
jgi:RNA polymerase sigma-70 factor (ECF subfamily)